MVTPAHSSLVISCCRNPLHLQVPTRAGPAAGGRMVTPAHSSLVISCYRNPLHLQVPTRARPAAAGGQIVTPSHSSLVISCCRNPLHPQVPTRARPAAAGLNNLLIKQKFLPLVRTFPLRQIHLMQFLRMHWMSGFL